MNNRNEVHEAYWQKERILTFTDYERNQVLPSLFTRNQLVLDLGCGDGAVARYLEGNKQARVVGIDFSPTALKKAFQKGISVILADVEKPLPIRSNSIDVVFFGDVVEHIYQPDKTLKEIRRVLKPKGKLILSCPNMGYWRYRMHYLLHGIIPETEWIAQELWESQHIRFFNKALLYRLLIKIGFTPIEFYGISRRRLDQPLYRLFPEIFGMIMVVIAIKQ